jgi:hypothetical protein
MGYSFWSLIFIYNFIENCWLITVFCEIIKVAKAFPRYKKLLCLGC